jgi:transposase
LRFQVTPGQSNDITVAPDLLDGLRVQAIHADKACDGNDLRVRIAAMKAMAVPPSNRNRKLSIPHDTTIY